MYQDIDINLLIPHPENSNFMKAETLAKLRKHIEQTNRYEPLTVRPHPAETGKYQVINGHNRLRVLHALNHKTTHCVVWNLDDVQTRLYLATLNRLSGNDIPERRAVLLESLATSFDADELAMLLPDDEKQLEELKRLSQIGPEELLERSTTEDKLHIPVLLSFMVDEVEAKEINLALDLLLNTKKLESRSQALTQIARFYLGHSNP